MSAKEKAPVHKGCKACKSRQLRESGRKQFLLELVLFKLGWMNKFIAKNKNKMAHADLLKLLNKIAPGWEVGNMELKWLEDMPRSELRRRFKHLYEFGGDYEVQHVRVAAFHEYASEPQPSHHHGDG